MGELSANELRLLIDGLCKQLSERTNATNGKADGLDVKKAERILELVKELANQ